LQPIANLVSDDYTQILAKTFPGVAYLDQAKLLLGSGKTDIRLPLRSEHTFTAKSSKQDKVN
jgi:hypothetical protein